nr:glycosyltransferase family 2 protein [Bacteroidota bacterium]
MNGIFKKKFNSARPLINVLIRTSNRPNYFRTCYESISGQTYNNIRILVSWDNEETKNYLKSYRKIRKTKVSLSDQQSYPQPDVPRGKKTVMFPPNLYLNRMMQQVKNGFIIYLDDDDVFMTPTSLETIANHISSENDLLFWRVQFPEGRLIPEDDYFGKPPEFWHISGIGFAFHSKYIPFA